MKRKKSVQKGSKGLKTLGVVASNMLLKIEKNYKKKPLEVIKSWPKFIGKLAYMTKVISFKEKVLVIKVETSTLLSLLNNYEKKKILKKMQSEFSEDIIQNIIFKLG